MAGIVVNRRHAQSALAADQQARQQRTARPDRAQTVRAIGAKLHLIALELLAGDVGWDPIGQKYLGFTGTRRAPPGARAARLLPSLSDTPASARGTKSPSVIIGYLRDGHLLAERRGRGAADLTHRHSAEREQQAALPFDRQCLPNRAGGTPDHRAIQASAPRRTMPGTQAAGVRRVVSTLQRSFVWDIENFFCKLKEFKRIAMRSDKTDTSFEAMIYLGSSLINSR
jgi:hypothetical protein